MARSRTSSSEFGAWRRSSTIFTSAYSLPMAGVVSSNANLSRAPLRCKGAGYVTGSVSASSPLDTERTGSAGFKRGAISSTAQVREVILHSKSNSSSTSVVLPGYIALKLTSRELDIWRRKHAITSPTYVPSLTYTPMVSRKHLNLTQLTRPRNPAHKPLVRMQRQTR